MSKAIIYINLPEGIHLENGRLTNIWSFVAAMYPGYTQSDEIAENNDLEKIAAGEWEEEDAAWKLIQDRWNGDEQLAIKEAVEELKYSNMEIYEAAIQGFIDNVEQIEIVYE